MTATTHQLSDLAARLDNCAADNLWALVAIGYPGWWYYEGQRMRTEYLLEWLKQDHYYNPIPYLQVELDEGQVELLARELGVAVAEILFEVRS